MFGTNEIVGRKFFQENAPNGASLFVTSAFMTLQGEGPFRGEPAFFLRLAKCNLACSFCDTYFDDGEWYNYDELDDKIYWTIDKYYDGDPPRWARRWFSEPRKMVLVITGGEPMLQPNLSMFLITQLDHFEEVQIESNGTQWQPLPTGVTLVVSPKCLEINQVKVLGSGMDRMHPWRYLEPNTKVMERADCLKFVMCAPRPHDLYKTGDPDLPSVICDRNGEVVLGLCRTCNKGEAELSQPCDDNPYCTIPEWAHEWRRETGKPIFVSPMNIYKREPARAKALRAKGTGSIEERSEELEVISFWEDGLLDMEANRRNHEYAARYCIQHGFTFNVQIHLLASVA
jgi:7-carboxy-7-deazaguanine synthase